MRRFPVPGKTVWFVRKVVDVTDEANALKEEMKAAGKWGMMAPRRLYAELEGRYGRERRCEVSCYSMWAVNVPDVLTHDMSMRLVGRRLVDRCFGGDTTGAGPSTRAISRFTAFMPTGRGALRPIPPTMPLKPRRVLQVATGGVHDGDFAMVIGFPGRTNRYGRRSPWPRSSVSGTRSSGQPP